jgi:N-acetylmuramoyl-L-alanine amidase
MSIIKLLALIVLLFSTSALQVNACTVMINPEGMQAGRRVDDNFERGVTLQCAQQIKKNLERSIIPIRVLLTRNAGQTVLPLQNANFANRLAPDFYLSLHFFQEEDIKPTIYAYVFDNNTSLAKPAKLALYPFDHAHAMNRTRTVCIAQQVAQFLHTNTATQQYTFQGVFHIPFKPLIGIIPPAIALEIGLKNADSLPALVELLSSLIELIAAHEGNT